MPGRDILALGEGEAEQPVGAVEASVDHVVEREIGLDGGVVEIGPDLPQLLGVIAPVPRRQREIAAFCGDQRLQGIAIGECTGTGRLPDPLQQAAHRLRRFGHRVLQPVGGEGREAQQPGGLLAQLQDLEDGFVVVVGVAIVAARGESLEHLFAQIAAGGALQERLHEGARQRHDCLAGHAALLGRGPGGRDKTFSQAVAIGLAELHEPVLLVAEQMMAEGGAEMGQPLVDLGHPLLGCLVEPGAGAVEAGIGALQQPQLLAR